MRHPPHTTDPPQPATWTGLEAEGLGRLRTALAAERTVFAVTRTGLAVAGGGTVIISLLGSRWPA